MTGAAAGILMLTCPLGEKISVLSNQQFQGFRKRVSCLTDELRGEQLEREHLLRLGLTYDVADKILALLNRETQLHQYLARGEQAGIYPVTRADAAYPDALEQKLGRLAPPALFCLGNRDLLRTKSISLVGSRRLYEPGRQFAEMVGRMAAEEGYTLVSGGAVGADTAATESCLRHGGSVIVFTPDRLLNAKQNDHVLYCSESGYEYPFSAQRALSRNRLIHALGEKTFVAQCPAKNGGTWQGTAENLQRGYSPVFVLWDGSKGAEGLLMLGASAISELHSISALSQTQTAFEE